ncbi:methionyl-trna synthetase beta subunit [Heterostelium album PN500]|uniref:Methionyl-trna synthetase beta subunit n=1 Tax=Heterostelium pallidum (strain ATCC 26659 / Pp 5 / PN500) TaxID=670386 RepID=D3BE14_HETP5|nr:methionyl-trna synthetase beta subunit [Heterostelium album PN500]EFA80145.1 methionyl-trna synthetase beta subunit [Heterostelium album PN500]|eukprot:XP_020432265.1 methionyl-trna synthetase beta subunit [Heterostelium album PN500]
MNSSNMLKNTISLISRSTTTLNKASCYNGALMPVRFASCCGGKSTLPPVAAGEITLDDFFKLDLRVAKVVQAEHVEGAKKLIKLTLDIGPKKKPVVTAQQTGEQSTENATSSTTNESTTPAATTTTQTEEIVERDIRTVFSGIKQHYQPEQLQGKNVIMVANLAPKKTKFGVSEGMVLFASDDESKQVLALNCDNAQAGFRVL